MRWRDKVILAGGGELEGFAERDEWWRGSTSLGVIDSRLIPCDGLNVQSVRRIEHTSRFRRFFLARSDHAQLLLQWGKRRLSLVEDAQM